MYALLISGSVTAVIVVLWIAFGLPGILGTDEAREVAEEKSQSPFAVALEYIQGIPAGMAASLESFGAVFSRDKIPASRVQYRAE